MQQIIKQIIVSSNQPPKKIQNPSKSKSIMYIILWISLCVICFFFKMVVFNHQTTIDQLLNLGGAEAEKILLISLFESLQLNASPSVLSLRKQLLKEKLEQMVNNYSFMEYIPFVLTAVYSKSPEKKEVPPDDTIDKLMQLQISLPIQLTIAVSMCMYCEHKEEWLPCIETILKEGNASKHFVKLNRNCLDALIQLSQAYTTKKDEWKELIAPIFAENISQFNIGEIDFLKSCFFLKHYSKENEPEPKIIYKPVGYAESLSAADVIEEVGALIANDQNILKEILQSFPNISEYDLMTIILKISANNGNIDNSNNKKILGVKSFIKNQKYDFTEDTFNITQKDNQYYNACWNFDSILKVLIDASTNAKWVNVFLTLDRPKLEFKNENHFKYMFILISKIKAYRKNEFTFPRSLIFERWVYSSSQVVFLHHLVGMQPEVFFFNEYHKRMTYLESSFSSKMEINSPNLQIWGCIDIIELLLNLSESEHYYTIKSLFDYPRNNCSDLLMLTLAATRPTQGSHLMNELYTLLFPIYLANHANSAELLEALWHVNNKLFIKALTELCKISETSFINLSRVLDISQQIKDSLLVMANSKDYEFSVALGVLAGKRDFLHLENWISDRIRNAGNIFVAALLKYIEDNLVNPSKAYINDKERLETILEKSQLVKQSLAVIFDMLLKKFDEQLSTRLKKIVRKHYKDICQIWPDFANSTSTYIEEAANGYFKKIYDEEISLEKFIEILKSYKTSNNSTEQEIFACMIHNLFDEYRFFTRYPHRELLITGQIFGSIINHKMIDGVTLRVALKCVQDSLRKDGKLFDFGLKSLEYFKQRVHEWTELCQHLFSNQRLREQYPEILDEIKNNLKINNSIALIPSEHIQEVEENLKKKKQPPPIIINNDPPLPVLTPNTSSNLNMPTQPPVVSTTVNNNIQPVATINSDSKNDFPSLDESLQPNNLQSKIKTKPILPQSDMNSMVESIPITVNLNTNYNSSDQNIRTGLSTSFGQPQPPIESRNKFEPVSLQIEKHKLYEKYLNDFKGKVDENSITTLKRITNSLTSENVEGKAQESRALLENNVNTSKWYVRNLLYDRISQRNMQKCFLLLLQNIGIRSILKDMSQESYYLFNYLLKIVINLPNFVSVNDPGVLDCIGEWIGLQTLAQSKAIILKDLDIKEILLSAYENKTLNNVLPSILALLWTITPEKLEKKFTVFKPNNPYIKALLMILAEIYESPEILQKKNQYLIETLFQDLGKNINEFPKSNFFPAKSQKNRAQTWLEYLTISDSLKHLLQFQNLKSIIVDSIDKVILDFLPAVVHRTVYVTVQAAKVITLKDYAFEPNETKVSEALKSMITSLAGKLALVLSREYLRMHMQNELKTRLQNEIKEKIDDQELEKEICDVVLSNLDLACKMVKQWVVEKALDELMKDQDIKHALQERKNASDSGLAYYDQNYTNIFKSLPEPLRPGTAEDEKELEKIYFNFSSSKSTVENPSVPMQPVNQISPKPQFNNKQEEYLAILRAKHAELLLSIENGNANTNENDAFHAFFENIPKDLDSPKELLMESGKNVLNVLLSKSKNEKILKDCADFLWDHVYYCNELTKENTKTILEHTNENYRYNPELQLILIKKNMIDLKPFDSIYAEKMANEFKQKIYQSFHCFFKVVKVITYKDKFIPIQKFSNILKFFSLCTQKSQNLNVDKEILKTIECILNSADANDQYYGLYTFSSKYKKKLSLYDEVFNFFGNFDEHFYNLYFKKHEEWVRNSENVLEAYLNNFENEIYKNPTIFMKFFCYTCELSISHAVSSACLVLVEKKIINKYNVLDYTYLDMLTKFIMVLLKTSRGPKKELLQNIVRCILIVFYKDHDLLNNGFNPRPYFRIFYNILFDIFRAGYDFDEQEKYDLMQVIVKTLLSIQPLLYPKFACSWLNLISLPYVTACLLNSQINLSHLFLKLIYAMLRFLRKLTDIDGMGGDSAKLFYVGVLRLFYCIFIDNPDFLSAEIFMLLQETPKQLHQLRNLILSTQPRDEASDDIPAELTHCDDMLVFDNFQQNTMKYFKKKKLKSLKLIQECLYVPIKNTIKINEFLLESYILFIPKMCQDLGSHQSFEHHKNDAHLLLVKLIKESDYAMREALFNAIVNNLRYPCTQSKFYYQFLILTLSEVKDENNVHEHLLRVLIERSLTEIFVPLKLGELMNDILYNPLRYRNLKIKTPSKSAEEFEYSKNTIADLFEYYLPNKGAVFPKQTKLTS